MDIRRIAVLGAGNGGYAMSADLTLAGYEVRLFEGKNKENLEPAIRRGGIELTGIARQGFAKISRITTNIAEAISGADVIMIATQSPGHESIAEQCAPHLVDGQIIVILPGNLGSVLFARILKEKGVRKSIKIAETNTFPYAARRVIGEAKVHISQFLKLHTAAFPARDTDAVLDTVKELYPPLFFPAANVAEVALSNPNYFHVPICLMNAAVIEKSPDAFYPYSQGASPAVVRIIEAVWRERGAVLKKLGLTDRFPFEWHREFFEKLTPEQAKITGPNNLRHRMISEDCPYGLVPLASIGEMIGVPTPATRALIALASEINGADYYAEGRNVERLGISGLSVKQLKEFFAW